MYTPQNNALVEQTNQRRKQPTFVTDPMKERIASGFARHARPGRTLAEVYKLTVFDELVSRSAGGVRGQLKSRDVKLCPTYRQFVYWAVKRFSRQGVEQLLRRDGARAPRTNTFA